jgi:hypothetical protein
MFHFTRTGFKSFPAKGIEMIVKSTTSEKGGASAGADVRDP